MSDRIFTDVDALAAAIEKQFSGNAVIGIDGVLCAGKTYLGAALASKLSVSHYDLDSALERDRGEFINALRLDEVRREIAGRRGKLLVSGLCMLQVMELAKVAVDGLIYVKRMSAWGWPDADELVDSMLRRLKGSAGGDALRREIRSYHAGWRPIERAHFEYHRLAD